MKNTLNADYSYIQDDGVNRDGSTNVTDEEGESISSSSSSGHVKAGQGYTGSQQVQRAKGASAKGKVKRPPDKVATLTSKFMTVAVSIVVVGVLPGTSLPSQKEDEYV